MNNRTALASVIAVVFVDLLGFSIVLPLMPFYASRFQASDTTIGLLVASYAVAQFFATPILGQLSDRYGRRPVLILSVLGSLLGFVMWAFAEPLGGLCLPGLEPHNAALTVLLASRVLDGFSGGNISVAQAYISDVTTPERRSAGMGMIGAAFGLGFILGPPLGGWLSSDGDFARPALVSATLAGLNLMAIVFFLKESRQGIKPITKRSAFPVAAILDGLRRPQVGLLLWVSFFYFLAFSTFTSIFSLYTLRRFQLSPRDNGFLLGFVGMVIVVTQVTLVGRFTRRFGEPNLVRYGIPTLALAMLGWGMVPNLTALLAVLVLIPMTAGMLNVSLRSSMSRVGDPGEVGTLMGVQASVESLTRAIGPILGALLMDHFGPGAPGIFAFITLAGLALVVGPKVKRLPDSSVV